MTTAFARMEQAAQQRDRFRLQQAASRFLRSKQLLAVVLGVLFWFSVPYSLPRHLPSANATIQEKDNAEQFDGAVSRQIAVPLLGLCAWYMLKRYPLRGRIGGRLALLVAFYVAWVFSSVVWSQDPSLTTKRLVVFGFDCLFTYALARTLSEMEMALGAFLAMFSTGVLSLLSDIFLIKDFAPFDPDYRLMGVMAANHQAENLVSAALVCVALMVRRPRWSRWLGPALVLTLAMLWITRARIGTILCIALVCFALFKLMRNRVGTAGRAAVVLSLGLLVAPTLVFLLGRDAEHAAQSAFMMGRKDTENTSNLSNRLPLWQELMDSVEEHPILGWGYGAFWTTERAATISGHQGWAVPHAHNTFLDQVIVLGYVGGALYAGIMFTALCVAWARYRRVRSSANLLNGMLLTWMVLLSMSEATPLEPHMPTIIVYAAVVRMCLREGSIDNADPVPDRPILLGMPEQAHSEQAQPPSGPAPLTSPRPSWRTPAAPAFAGGLRRRA